MAQIHDFSKRGAVINEEIGLSFDDVLLVPNRSVLAHRADADISTNLVKGISFDIPIVSAPMQSVTESEMTSAIGKAGGFGILHRFQTVDEQCTAYLNTLQSNTDCGCAIGIDEGYERFRSLLEIGCKIFCLDVAHAHHERVSKFIGLLPEDGFQLIAGNVATHDGALFLASLGVQSIKVGIGPGAACVTREVTGFGVPQLSAIMEVKDALSFAYPNVTIIADGGIRNSGDIVKALAAGADSVMLGRLLAGADESPHPGLYWGMASKRVNGHHAPEGVEGAVPRTGPVRETLKELAWGIRSGVSYSGGTNLQELRENAQFIRVTSQSIGESGHRL